MAADVLTYNALQEINQELKAESAALTAGITSAGGGGGEGGAVIITDFQIGLTGDLTVNGGTGGNGGEGGGL